MKRSSTVLLLLTIAALMFGGWASLRLAIEKDLTVRLEQRLKLSESRIRVARAVAFAQAIRVADMQARCPEETVLGDRKINVRYHTEASDQ